MASFRKLFSPSSPRSSGEVPDLNGQQCAHQYPQSPTTSHEPAIAASPYAKPPQTRSHGDPSRHYEGIEKQFEQLHETFYSRTLASLRNFRYTGSNDCSEQRNRHIDVVEALFSNHRYQISSMRSLSPITPYNEDIADRNIIAQHLPQLTPHYSRLLSGTYQEDVADRNITRSKSSSIYRGLRSSQLTVRSDHQEQTKSQLTPDSHDRLREPRTSYPPARLAKSQSRERMMIRNPNHLKEQPPLRPQVSAPDLSTVETKTPDLASFPRPPSSGAETTEPIAVGESENMPSEQSHCEGEAAEASAADEKKQKENHNATGKSPCTSEESASNRTTKRTSRTSKKNVHDLMINTDIAAMKKPSIRIEHCAIQPPASHKPMPIMKNPSIDEVVRNPLLAVNADLRTPQTSSTPALDINEIMKILKQAYKDSTPNPRYPTFESLQEIIVREINSHDAFRNVPAPNDSLYTPPSSEDSVEDDILLPPPGPSRVKPLPEKESTISRLIRRKSSHGIQTRNSSASNVSLVQGTSPQVSTASQTKNNSPTNSEFDGQTSSSLTKKIRMRDSGPIVPRRRRHTYGEPSTPSAASTPISQDQQQQPQQKLQPRYHPQPQPQPQPQHQLSTQSRLLQSQGLQSLHTSSASVSSSSSFSLFPPPMAMSQPRYKSHFKRKSDPVPPSPHYTEFNPVDAATPPIYPSYVRPN